MTKKSIMVQGTSSSCGKSLMVTAFCRIFLQDGYKVAPFKSQNMALNSYITEDGFEMGRAQVVQAEASRLKPRVEMNPILLKPTTDKKAQIILEGKVFKNMDAKDYFEYKKSLILLIKKNFDALQDEFNMIVIEGAGSPAEINLKENDIVNMGVAQLTDSPVILVSDIDRGGVFASIVGTIFLLTEEEKKRVKGIIINKFRGDLNILKPGIDKLEEIIKIPVLGVVPYLDVKIEDEDSVTNKFNSSNNKGNINIVVIKLPHISNFTDFDVFGLFPEVNLRYVSTNEEIGSPDILIIPGTKNTIEDLIFLKERGIDKKIVSLQKEGKIIAGICGGFQMLGKKIQDPYSVESSINEITGLGLLDIETIMLKEKVTKQITCKIIKHDGIFTGNYNDIIDGYEIHMGETSKKSDGENFLDVSDRVISLVKNNVFGTYIHGFFDNTEFTKKILNNIQKQKGSSIIGEVLDYKEFKDKEYDKLADIVRKSVDMEKIYQILEGKNVF